MLVLFDNGTPRDLARYLIDHPTVTEHRNLRVQQNLAGRKIAVVALGAPGSCVELEIPPVRNTDR
jgi:sorbitol-specific phosphotransferase system component IIA